MKLNRRKQTNPNRVSAGTRAPDLIVPSGVNDAPTSQDEESHEAMEGVANSCLQTAQVNGQSLDNELPLDMHVSVFACHYCSEAFPSLRKLETHEAELHGPAIKKARLDQPCDVFPTAYHRLGRELQENGDAPLSNGHPENEFQLPAPSRNSPPVPTDSPHSPPLKISSSEKLEEGIAYQERHHPPNSLLLKSGKESSGEPINGKSDRIFHMDAYCELCDREFCNKYFLKTHKANKHGVYEANSPPANTVPAPFPGLLIPQDPLTSFSFKMDSMKAHLPEPLLPWSFKMDSPSQQEKISDVTSSVRSTDPSVSVFSAPLPLIDSPTSITNKPTISSYDNVNARSLHSSSSNSISVITSITNSTRSGPTSSAAPPSNDSSMEDYCQICQKHFCNKYYLKKHKQDVHGIVPENSPSSCTKRSRSGVLDLPMTPNNPMMLPQSLSNLAGMHGLSGMPGLSNMHSVPPIPSMPPGMMVINPYTLPPVALIPAGSLMPGQQIPPPPHHPSHPIISQSMSIAPVPESILHNHTPPTTISLANSNSTGHLQSKSSPSIHDSGVHCNICTKEFCNEFYLQIHKESKHGIRRSFEEDLRDNALPLVKETKDDKPFSPLISDNGKIEPCTPHALDPLSRRTPIDGGVLICNLCNKDYTNRYLFRIHRIHDHGLNELTDPMLAETGEIPQKDRIIQNMNESLIRMSADAPAVGYASSFDASSSSSSNNHQEPAICDICNKQQLSQYSLRLHKFNIHGIDQSISEKYDVRMNCSPGIYNSKPKTPTSSGSLSISSPGQQQQQQQPLNLTPLPGKHPLLPFLPPKIDFKDMPPFVDFSRDFKGFREMPSFLTDTIGSELFVRSQSQAMHMDLNLFGLPSIGKLPMDDGIKLNFDPEAYCEICKKEFCSKYFLRTHKQNIHGIKSDTPSSTSSRSSDGDKTSTVMTQMKPINGSICSNSSTKPREGLDKNSWRWKEPMNSSRVICDICNKEVCNKYFLRTHKQKKHGIAATPQSPNISTSGSPVASDCDTTSNASSQLDEKPFRMDVFCLPPMIPLPPTERMPEKFHIKLPNFDKVSSEILPFNNNIEQNETCNICSRRFKNMKWLKDHIVKDHTDPGALDMRAKCSTPVYTCQVCGIHFPAELSIQLHLIQEHNARVTVDSEETQIPTEEANLPNSEGNSNRVAELCGRWTLRKKVSNHQRVKKYVCNRCGFDSHWLSSLLDHERNEHGIMSDFAPSYSCKICHHMVPSPKSLSGHLVTVHGLTIENARHEIELAEPVIPNSFKCVHCPAVFPTRSWGMAHVRHVHIHSRRDLAVKNMFVKSLFRCPSCPFKTHFAFRLQQHVKCRHVSCLRPSSSNRSSQSFSSPSSSSSSSSSSSLITSTSSLRKRCDAPGPRSISKGDTNLVTASAVYKSIAASLLSAPETVKGENPRESIDRESLLLQSYQLPLGTSPVDSSTFKMALQASASAVVGL